MKSVVVHVDNLRVVSTANLREHFFTKSKRVNAEKEAVEAEMYTVPKREREHLLRSPEVQITFTRCAPRQLDDDNLASGFKGIRDFVAVWLGKDDKPGSGLTWAYKQEKSKDYGVRIVMKSNFEREPQPKVEKELVDGLALCVVFAINGFKNKPVVDENNKMRTWHDWFKEALTNAGYKLTEPEKK